MIALKYLLIILGIGLFGSAGALVIYDVYVSSQLRRLLRRSSEETSGGASATSFLSSGPFGPVRWQRALRLALLAVVPLLISKSIVVFPDGTAGVRVSQFWGARPGTLYPGVHLVTPFVDKVALYDTREQVYLTAATEGGKNVKEKQNPMPIQKIIAERLSDKLQIMMVPVDGKNFFANDVFRSAFSGLPSAAGDDDSDGNRQLRT